MDQLVSLSFYKKTITTSVNTREYNIKGIYGMNGSGKSGIITSAEILRDLLIDPGYLNNPIAQKNLSAIINKKIGELFIEADYMVKLEEDLLLFRYNVILSKDVSGKYVISHECLSFKQATSKSEVMKMLFEVTGGEIAFLYRTKEQDNFSDIVQNRTMNLLETAAMSALFYEKLYDTAEKNAEVQKGVLWAGLCLLYLFGRKIYVYVDQSDDHRDFVVWKALEGDSYDGSEKYKNKIDTVAGDFVAMKQDYLHVLSATGNVVWKLIYEKFEKEVDKLWEFLRIFKSDLLGIEIDKKENRNFWICDLVMVYEGYKIHAEYESTGIKKLIKLFAYLKEMVKGGIVFIDEFDSNLHDVYLCALLEYLMEYGEGQLCFTTHNVGSMDILKQRKKSIDFLSENHKIYSWKTNGNYSPSRLYRNGMIEGSPFNVDSIDFISVFGAGGEVE